MTAGDGGEERENMCGEEVREERQGTASPAAEPVPVRGRGRITGGGSCTMRNRCIRKM
jgi:hypothetical protein